MRINTNVSALAAQKNLWGTQQEASKSMDKLSSGFRINRAADDAAGLGIANKLRADTKSLQQAFRNVEQGNAVLQIAEGSVSTIGKMLERMKELATQAASDTTETTSRAQLDTEYQQLLGEIDRIVGSTSYQGDKLIDGSAGTSGTLTFQIGASNTANDRLSVVLSNMDTTGLAVTGGDVTSQANARTAMSAIDTAITTVNTEMGKIGAYQNRLEYTGANLKSAVQNNQAAESVIRDLDMAEEMAKFTKLNILSQAGTAMLAQANQSTQGVLQLLRG